MIMLLIVMLFFWEEIMHLVTIKCIDIVGNLMLTSEFM